MAIRDLLLLLPLATGALAHGKPASPAEQEAMHSFLAARSEPMSICRREMGSRGLLQDAAIRRSNWANAIRKEKGLPTDTEFGRLDQLKRDLSEVIGKDHRSNLTGLTWDSDPNKLF